MDFSNEAYEVIKLAITKKIDYFISAASLTDIFYIINKKLKDLDKSRQMIRNVLKFVSIAGVDESCILNALNSEWPDFEDSVQHEVASQIKADYIVTRNIKDYQSSTIVVVTPSEFLQRIK